MSKILFSFLSVYKCSGMATILLQCVESCLFRLPILVLPKLLYREKNSELITAISMYFRVCQLLQPKQGSLTPLEKPREETLLQWLHLIQPGLSSFTLPIKTWTLYFFKEGPRNLSPSMAGRNRTGLGSILKFLYPSHKLLASQTKSLATYCSDSDSSLSP